MTAWSKHKELSSLKKKSARHKTQESIDPERVHLLLACAIHYNLHIPKVIRYLGGEFTSAHRYIQVITSTLSDHG